MEFKTKLGSAIGTIIDTATGAFSSDDAVETLEGLADDLLIIAADTMKGPDMDDLRQDFIDDMVAYALDKLKNRPGGIRPR